MLDTISALRAHAINNTLFAPKSLHAAVEQMGFVQADPIRSPRARRSYLMVQGFPNIPGNNGS